MNLHEYISSGIIESYVLNQLTNKERIELEEMAAQYREVRAEIAAVEEVLSSYALAHSKPPPEYLKEQIFAKIQQPKTPVKKKKQ